MRKTAFLYVLIFAGLINVIADELPKKAVENPLDLAFYLMTKDRDARRAESVADALFEVGRYDDAVRAIGFDDSENSQINWFVFRARILAERKNGVKAAEFLDKALELSRRDGTSLDNYAAAALASLLIKFDRNEEAARLPEISDHREKVIIGVAKEFLKAGKPADALRLLPPLSEIEEVDLKAEIIELYARLKQTSKAEKLLAEFEPTAFVREPIYHNQRSILFPLINANLALGRADHAVELWEQYGEKDDGYGWIKFIDSLTEFGCREKAGIYLARIAAEPEILRGEGSDIVRIYLQLGDVEKARRTAKTMSEENDSHEQQSGLILIADHFIADSKYDSASEILDFAFNRAAKVVFEHEDLQSNGASSGTRKRMYLNNIYRRFMKIKRYKKAFAAINAIGSDHWIAKEFVMEGLFDFLKQRAKTLPRRETENLLRLMQNSFTERNEDHYRPQAKLFTAEIYALIGEKTKASEFLAKAVAEGKESCCYEFGFLLGAGKVFERQKLKADANIQKALREFTVSAF